MSPAGEHWPWWLLGGVVVGFAGHRLLLLLDRLEREWERRWPGWP